MSKNFRELQSLKPKTRLFLSWIGEHNPVTSSSIARWLKQTMKDAGIDISIFKLHSVQGAACSKAAGAGVTTTQILEAADWSSEGTFQKFCHRGLEGDDKTNFGTSVWYPKVLQTIHVDMKQSLLKCNLWMAQGTKCLQAIRNYMRKVKLKYQQPHPVFNQHTFLSFQLLLLFRSYRSLWCEKSQNQDLTTKKPMELDHVALL